MSELVDAYVKYAEARREARFRASLRVEEEIKPALEDVGAAILQAQQDGMTIADIARTFGTKNRNFIYQAKRAHAAKTGEDPQIKQYVSKPKEQKVAVEERIIPDGPLYFIEDLSETEYEVTVFGETENLHYDTRAKRVIAPEEWAEASAASRQVYRDIIRDIEGRHSA